VNTDADTQQLTDPLYPPHATHQVVLYGGARHEIFNETNRGEVMEDCADWIASVLGGLGVTSRL
jgi:alpha-beta hydrolase superfamily lysophospholipase